jgi:hypothetical protein
MINIRILQALKHNRLTGHPKAIGSNRVHRHLHNNLTDVNGLAPSDLLKTRFIRRSHSVLRVPNSEGPSFHALGKCYS